MLLLESSLLALANPTDAAILARFFKTGPGEYGEGDKFLGIKIPPIRALVKLHAPALTFVDISNFLASEWHELRTAGTLSLVWKFQKSKSSAERREIFEFYIAHAKSFNNWDLVDLSTPYLFGEFLRMEVSDKAATQCFDQLMQSENLWERRIAMVGTFAFLKAGISHHTIRLAEKCLTEKESLMHKASGWMLREMGKRCSRAELLGFVEAHLKEMPRTMLRYSLEHLPKEEYRRYLEK